MQNNKTRTFYHKIVTKKALAFQVLFSQQAFLINQELCC